jgi:hypothetical protein
MRSKRSTKKKGAAEICVSVMVSPEEKGNNTPDIMHEYEVVVWGNFFLLPFWYSLAHRKTPVKKNQIAIDRK